MTTLTDRLSREAAHAIDDQYGCGLGCVPIIHAKMVELVEVCEQWLRDRAQFYPTDIFLPPPPGKHGKTVDGCSAAALRWAADSWAKQLRSAILTDEEPTP